MSVHLRSEVLLFCFILIIEASIAANPGFKTTVSQGGLTYLKDVGMTVLESKIGTLSIPNESGEADTPVGHIKYDITKINLFGVKLLSSSVTLVPTSEAVALKISQISGKISLDWEYKKSSFPPISDHGTCDITFSSASGAATINIGEAQGRPTAHALACAVSIPDLDITFHGGASWFYDLFKKTIADNIKKDASKSLGDALKDGINDGLEKTLATLPVVESINKWLYVNYSLLAPPTIASSYFSLGVQGEFFDVRNHTVAPFTPATLPNSVTTEMVQMFVTDYMFDTFSTASFDADKLHYEVVDSMLPTAYPTRLNTSYFQDTIPDLYTKFPKMMMVLEVYSTKIPEFTITTTGGLVRAEGNIEFHIAKNSKDLVFTLGAVVFCGGTVSIRGLNLTGHLSFLNVSLTLKGSTVGQFAVSVVQGLINEVLDKVVVPIANTALEPGFPLPTIDGIHFVKPVIGWENRYLYISTNITYTAEEKPGKVGTKIFIN